MCADPGTCPWFQDWLASQPGTRPEPGCALDAELEGWRDTHAQLAQQPWEAVATIVRDYMVAVTAKDCCVMIAVQQLGAAQSEQGCAQTHAGPAAAPATGPAGSPACAGARSADAQSTPTHGPGPQGGAREPEHEAAHVPVRPTEAGHQQASTASRHGTDTCVACQNSQMQLRSATLGEPGPGSGGASSQASEQGPVEPGVANVHSCCGSLALDTARLLYRVGLVDFDQKPLSKIKKHHALDEAIARCCE